MSANELTSKVRCQAQKGNKFMEHENELRDLRKWITKLLPRNNDYPVLNLIYHILIEAERTPIDPPMPENNHVTA